VIAEFLTDADRPLQHALVNSFKKSASLQAPKILLIKCVYYSACIPQETGMQQLAFNPSL
jgi:hypothetical protein